jgi:Flp pilus assembly protein TadD
MNRRRLYATACVLALAVPLQGCAGAAMSLLSFASGPITSAVSRALIPSDDAQQVDTKDIMGLAERMRAEGDLQAAAGFYSRAHMAEPNNPTPLIRMGECLALLGNDQDASVAFTRALAIDPANEAALRGLGKSHLMLHQPDLAASRFEALLAVNPRDVQAMNGLGIAYDMRGDRVRAQQTYQAALVVEPGNRDIINNLGLSMALGGNVADAIQMLQAANRSPSATPVNRQNLALAYGLAGRYDDAAQLGRADLDESAVAHNRDVYASGKSAGYSALVVNASLSNIAEPATLAGPAPAQPASAPEQASAVPVEPVAEQLAAVPTESEAALIVEPIPAAAPTMPVEVTPLEATDNTPIEEAAPTEPAAPAILASAPAATVDPDSTVYRIQLGSFASTELALTGWRKLRDKVGDLLTGFEPVIAKAILGDNGKMFYRLRSRSFDSRIEAKAACEQVKLDGIDCLVVRTTVGTETPLALANAHFIPSQSPVERTQVAAAN